MVPEDQEVEASPGAAPKKPKFAASSLVASGIFLSRIAGLIRDRVLAGYFGTSMFADVVRAGLRMPNLLQNLLGEGTLSASFIPVYSELLEQGRRKEAGRMAGAIFALLFAIAGGVALLGVLFAPQLTDFFLPGFEGEKRALTIQITRIIFPMTGILVLSAWALGILNSHRHFFVSYVAPVFWNGAIIGTLLIFGGRMDAPSLVVAFAWGALLGGLLQFGVQLPWVIKLDRELRISWNTRLEPVREAARNAGPAIMGRGVVQLSGYVDMVLASFLVTGSLAVMSFAVTLYVLPISLFGMSVAASELPELSRQRSGSPEALRIRTNAALQRIAFYIVPSFVAIVLLGDALVAALYQTGEFDRIDTLLVYLTLVGFSVGLLASTATRLFSSTFFALHDTGTPARVASVRVALAAVLGFSLMVQFEGVEIFGYLIGPGLFGDVTLAGNSLGVVGLAIGAGAAAWVEWWLLRRSLRKRIGKVGASAGPLARMFVAALTAAAAGWAVRWILPEVHPVVAAIFIFGTYGVVYFGVAAALHLDEMQGVRARASSLAGRFRR